MKGVELKTPEDILKGVELEDILTVSVSMVRIESTSVFQNLFE